MADDELERLYKLKINPFASRVQPDAPMAGRSKEREVWQQIVNDKTGSHAASLNFVIGDYGLGKTHTLYHIVSDARAIHGVTSVFMKMLPEDQVKLFGQDFIRRIFKNLVDPVILQRLAKVKLLPTDHRLYDHSKILKEFAGGVAFFRDLLTGGNVSKGELSKRLIRKVPSTTEIALEFLTVLLVQLHGAGVKSLVLCVDEAEYIFSQLSATKSALVFNALRAMYDLTSTPNLGLEFDGKISNIIFFFGISADGWSKLKNLEKVESHTGGPIQPLMSRCDRLISLSTLSKPESKDLIEKYLHASRTTGKPQPSPLIPYDSDFVVYVYDLTKGHPRDIVQRCEYVLHEGLRDQTKLLTRKYAKGVFERLNMTS